MKMRLPIVAAACAAALAASVRGQDDSPRAEVVRTDRAAVLAAEFPVSERRVVDVDGDGLRDLLVVGTAGEVRTWRHLPPTDADPSSPLARQPAGTLVLSEPERSLLAVADALGTGKPQLLVLTRQGLFAHGPSPDGSFARAGTLVSKDARLPLRTGRPRFADFVTDVDGDGHPDVVVPKADACELWLWQAPAEPGAPPAYRRAATLRVNVSRERRATSEALSDILESSFRIPRLDIRDVNGDGHRDLCVEEGKTRAFHLAGADGAISSEPTVSLDLEIFRDTTPEAEVRLGRTLAGSDDQRYESRDLDGDGIPDHVISHRRKVWVFHGRTEGPQFTEPTQILKVADDVTALLLLRLDEDPRPDLLLLRIQVPSIATILRGLVTSWDVEIGALGYAGKTAGRGFETEARWKGELSVRLPAILGVLRDPDALIRRFEDVSRRFRAGTEGDFDGDGKADLAIADAAVASDADEAGEPGVPRGVALWTGREAPLRTSDSETEMARVFFGDDDRVWDLDRILRWLGTLADQRAARLTGGRPADARITFRPAHEAEFEEVLVGDVTGGAGDEILVCYELEDGRGAIEVWTCRKAR
ncbi:MAG: hypothetical protein HMLKMBBP_00887 [Planctomycetes bacterium]|nr:hypothetical protein [Planctomycetota bacterium]